MTELFTASARAQAAAIRAKKISSVELTTEVLKRLEAAHKKTHCVIALERDDALAAAKAADTALAKGEAKGLLHGVPLAHKDMFDRVGRIPSWGAKIRATEPARKNAGVIERFRAQGAIEAAALHLTEFAFGPTGHNYVLGHARNPYDPARITGGSSSGTSCAVALGAIPAGLGSDTAGSLRLPASNCGVSSIKPTWGRVTRTGAMPLALCLDTLGVISRHVEDQALMLGFLAGRDVEDGHTSDVPVPDYLTAMAQPVKGLKLGIDDTLIGEAAPEIVANLMRAVDALANAGLTKAKCRFADWQTIDHLTQVMQLPDAASAHHAYMMTRPGDYGPQVRARLEVGHFINAVDHMTALRARGRMLAHVLDTTFKNIDVAILPVNADPLPTIADLDVAGSPQVQAVMARVVKYCRPINYLGLPTLTLQVPRNGGLPNGIQLVAKPYHEGLLFAIGAAYQRLVPPEVAPH